ncbi:MAG: AEC family transporter [Erysipelotrichaceae bacterium]|nr:AEC family transporter [Erysipelotrichaceae bacterium]
MTTKIVIEQIVSMYLLVLLGYIMYKKNIFDNHAIEKLTTFLLKYVTLFIIINSIVNALNTNTQKDFFTSFLLAIIINVILITVSLILYGKRKPLIAFSSVFTNASFMGIPLTYALLKEKGILFLIPFVVIQAIATWTYGIWLFNKNKMNREETIKILLFNPAIVGLVISLIIHGLSIQLPTPITICLGAVSSLNTPLAMIILGSFVAKIGRQHFKDILTIIEGNVARLILMPIIAIAFFYFFKHFDKELITTFIIAISAPIAISTSMFALKYNQDVETASVITMISTLSSIITIPLMLIIAEALKII